jgi:hypothetical protein
LKTYVEVVSSFLEGGWRAECSCGWKGERYTTTNAAGLSPANQASHDAIRHRPAVTSDRDWTVGPREILGEWIDERRMGMWLLATPRNWPLRAFLDGAPMTAHTIAALILLTGIRGQFWVDLDRTHHADLAAGRKDSD